MTSRLLRRPAARIAYEWSSQVIDLRRVARVPRALYDYLADWRVYRSLEGAERLNLWEARPQLHDRTTATDVDAHYFYSSAWCGRAVFSARPKSHVDVGSNVLLAALLAAQVPTTFVDFRPLSRPLEDLARVAGDILHLPFASNSLISVSCIHVAEHIGLGRYGDPLNPKGTVLAAAELSRVLAPGGQLLFGIPIGRRRVNFNAHRVHLPTEVAETLFPDLVLVEFAVVDDHGAFVGDADPQSYLDADYACGMFRFTKPR